MINDPSENLAMLKKAANRLAGASDPVAREVVEYVEEIHDAAVKVTDAD